MKPTRLILIAAIAAGCANKPPENLSAEPTPSYPDTPRVDLVETYFGTPVADPYRWLEDSESAQTREWIRAQNALTSAHLDDVDGRDTIRGRLTELFRYDRFGVPHKKGGRYFYTQQPAELDQPQHWVTSDLSEPGTLLLDANDLSEDGTVTITGLVPSDDGSFVAYAVADAGTDWRTWRIRDVATGEDLRDELRWVKFSGVSWTDDHKGFFYSRYPEPSTDFEAALGDQRVYYHALGTHQDDDILIYEDAAHPQRGYSAEVSHDGDTLVLSMHEGTEEKARVHLLDIDALPIGRRAGRDLPAPTPLLDAFDADYRWLGQRGDDYLFLTDHNAPRRRVIAVDPRYPAQEAWEEVIPQGEHTLQSAQLVGGRLVARYLRNSTAWVRMHDPDGQHLTDLELPGLGSAGGFGGDPDDPETFFWFHSFTQPAAVYRLNVREGTPTVFRTPDVAFEPSDYVTEQVWFDSADGTKVPMFITRRADLTPSGEHPTLLYGYGGFNIPLTPRFDPGQIAWLEMGGVYAVANLRGGGEFGREWHEAGTQLHKQNVFDDFIGAAEYLVREGWTRPERLAIHGRSNGGLLVGAVLTQRPDLFGAALPAVGVLDMLRYHKFTIGWAWASDYGTSEQSEEMFRYLLNYSPVHNARPGTDYPPTLILTADHDDRVVPGHSYKFAAALQHAQAAEEPILIRIETRSGHGGGAPTHMKIDEHTDRLAFMRDALGMAD